MFVEGVRAPPGAICRTVFSDWNSVFRRFSRWSQKDVWRRTFEQCRTILTSST